MNREEIEEKDQRLLKEFRAIVSSKEKKPLRRKPFWKATHFWMPILIVGLMMAGLTAFREPSTIIVSDNLAPPVGDTFNNNKPFVLEAFADQNAATDAKVLASTSGLPENTGPSASSETDQPEKETLSQKIVPEVPLNTVFPEETRATAQSLEPSGMPSNIQISKIISCSGVCNRQYVSPGTMFSIKENPKPVVWMTVLSDNPPFSLTHVYYVNGRKYCEVPLEIKYKHMRTWSHVTLDRMNQTGTWRVEVIADDGEKLEQIEFTVVP